jgi:hypothetical protein
LAPGFEYPEDAADSFGAELQVEVEDWHDFATNMYFGQHHLTLSDHTIMLPFFRYSTRQVDVDSTQPYTIQWLDENEDPIGNEISAPNEMIDNGRFEATIIKDPTDSFNVNHIEFRALADNNVNNPADMLLLTTANWSVKILVDQESTAQYSTSTVSVMSFDRYGSLGDMTEQTTANNSLAMRRMIDKNFSPTADFKIAGFNYTRVPTGWEAYTPTYPSATNWANLMRLINQQDVIFLPYLCNPTSAVCTEILRWLDGDTKRVLIVGTDSVDTNPNMLLMLTSDGAWRYAGNNPSVSTTGTGYKGFVRAADSPGTEPFFNGPFGAVSADLGFARADDIAGHNLTYPDNIIPLIVGNLDNQAMYYGVNFERRIVYFGDQSIFTGAVLSNENGNIVTDADKLLSNMWAWIAAHVIYGDGYNIDF